MIAIGMRGRINSFIGLIFKAGRKKMIRPAKHEKTDELLTK